jgi:hypothetical protein
MTKTPRWLCALLVVAVAFTGPFGALAPIPAAAQSSSVVYSGDQPPEYTEPTEGDRIGAGFMNVVYVPGKVIICTAGTVATIGLLLLTFGTAVHAAREVWREGCTGDWVVRPEHLSGKEPLLPEVN